MTLRNLGNQPALIAGLAGILIVLVVASVFVLSLGPRPATSPSPLPSGVAELTPSPGPSTVATFEPSALPTSSPGLTTPSPSPSSSASPNTSPFPSPSPSPSPSPGPSLPASAFVAVEGFPASDERIREIISFGSGFIAVGWAEHPTDECPYRNDGRIWSSADGQRWLRRDGDALPDAVLDNVVVFNGMAYAFGYIGVPGDCPVPDGFANNVWRSRDGVNWERISNGLPTLSETSRIRDVAVAGDHLVAVGRFGDERDDDESPLGGAWTSNDALNWRAADQAPGGYDIVAVAAMGDSVAAFGDDASQGLAWYSLDGGRSWQSATVDAGYLPYSVKLNVLNGRFVASTQACCGVPGTTVGVELLSTDGRNWSAPAGNVHRTRGEGADVYGGQLFVFSASGELNVSNDGERWRAYGAPQLERTDTLAVAAIGASGAVLVAWQEIGGSIGQRAYFAPAAAFSGPGVTPEAPEPVEMGRKYPYELYTHCGSANTRVVFDGSVWIVDSVESGPIRDPDDRGQLTKIGTNVARYTNRRGGSILLSRTATPPPWPQCA